MRCDQHIGLNERALKFLDENAKKDLMEIYKNGEKIASEYSMVRIPGKFPYYGMFDDDEPSYHPPGYELANGTIVYEACQCSPWASGPMFFMHLVDEDGISIDETLDWESNEINQY